MRALTVIYIVFALGGMAAPAGAQTVQAADGLLSFVLPAGWERMPIGETAGVAFEPVATPDNLHTLRSCDIRAQKAPWSRDLTQETVNAVTAGKTASDFSPPREDRKVLSFSNSVIIGGARMTDATYLYDTGMEVRTRGFVVVGSASSTTVVITCDHASWSHIGGELGKTLKAANARDKADTEAFLGSIRINR